MYALDGASDVAVEHFEKMKLFVQNAIRSFGMMTDKLNVGLIAYGKTVNEYLSTNQQQTIHDIENITLHMKKVGGFRDIAYVMNFILKNYVNDLSAKKVLVLFKAGPNLNGEEVQLSKAVSSLEASGWKIIVLAVGDKIFSHELNLVSTGNKHKSPSINQVFKVKAQELQFILGDVENAVGRILGNLFKFFDFCQM